MSLSQATDHSVPQLKLLAEAANRLRARHELIRLDSTYAAVAACMTDKGQSILRKVRQNLQKIAKGE